MGHFPYKQEKSADSEKIAAYPSLMKVFLLIFAIGVAFSIPAKANDDRVDASVQRAIVTYPTSSIEGSPLYNAILQCVEVYEKQYPEFFKNPLWPEILTTRMAKSLGIKPDSEAFSAMRKRSEMRAISLYPEIADEKSIFHQAVSQKLNQLSKSDPDFFSTAIWPEILIEQEAIIYRRTASVTPASEIDIEEAIRRDLHILDYLDLKDAFAYLDKNLAPGDDRIRGIKAAARMGIDNNPVQQAYFRAIMNGASESEANAIKQTALLEEQNALLSQNNYLSRQQLRETREIRRTLEFGQP